MNEGNGENFGVTHTLGVDVYFHMAQCIAKCI